MQFNGTSTRTQTFVFTPNTSGPQSKGAHALEGSVLLSNFDPHLSPDGKHLFTSDLLLNSRPRNSPFAPQASNNPLSTELSGQDTPTPFLSVPSGSLVWQIESAQQVTHATVDNHNLYRVSVFPSSGSSIMSGDLDDSLGSVVLRYRLNEGNLISLNMEGQERREHGWITVYPSDDLHFSFTYSVRQPAQNPSVEDDHILLKTSQQFRFSPIQGGPYFGVVGSLAGVYDPLISRDIPWLHCREKDFSCQFSNGCASCSLGDHPASCGVCLEMQSCQVGTHSWQRYSRTWIHVTCLMCVCVRVCV